MLYEGDKRHDDENGNDDDDDNENSCAVRRAINATITKTENDNEDYCLMVFINPVICRSIEIII